MLVECQAATYKLMRAPTIPVERERESASLMPACPAQALEGFFTILGEHERES